MQGEFKGRYLGRAHTAGEFQRLLNLAEQTPQKRLLVSGDSFNLSECKVYLMGDSVVIMAGDAGQSAIK